MMDTALPGMAPPKPYTITTEPGSVTVTITDPRMVRLLAIYRGYQGTWWRDMFQAAADAFGEVPRRKTTR